MSPLNSIDKTAKVNVSPEKTPAVIESPNSSSNATPTVRRVSNGEGSNNNSETPDGPHKCHLCGKGFNKATYLKRHILSHSSVKPYKCDICNWGM